MDKNKQLCTEILVIKCLFNGFLVVRLLPRKFYNWIWIGTSWFLGSISTKNLSNLEYSFLF